MSAISCAGSNSVSQLMGRQAGGTQDRSGFPARFQKEFESAATAAGVDASKLPDLEKQVQDAVAKVRQSPGTTGDTRGAIRDAVEGVLKQNGVDVTKFRAAMEADRPHRHHGSSKAPDKGADSQQSATAAAQFTGSGALLDTTA